MEKKAIVLNPKLKNDDFLDIVFLDIEKNKKGFTYEIDSLKLQAELPFGNVRI
jgi:hypothetical protein